MVHLFKMKGLLGKNDGYMSKKGLVIMLLSWLMHKDFIQCAQKGAYTDSDKVKEKKAAVFPQNQKDLKHITEEEL